MKLLHNKLYYSNGIKNILILTFIFSFLLSFFLKTNFINISFLTQFIGVDNAIGARLDFMNSDYVTNLVKEQANNSLFLTVKNYFQLLIKIYLFISVLLINYFFRRENFKVDTKTLRLFSFVILFLSFY